jgi:hypothetical protein
VNDALSNEFQDVSLIYGIYKFKTLDREDAGQDLSVYHGMEHASRL